MSIKSQLSQVSELFDKVDILRNAWILTGPSDWPHLRPVPLVYTLLC